MSDEELAPVVSGSPATDTPDASVESAVPAPASTPAPPPAASAPVEMLLKQAFEAGRASAAPPVSSSETSLRSVMESMGYSTFRLQQLAGLDASQASLALNLLAAKDREFPAYGAVRQFEEEWLSFCKSAGYLRSNGSVASSVVDPTAYAAKLATLQRVRVTGRCPYCRSCLCYLAPGYISWWSLRALYGR